MSDMVIPLAARAKGRIPYFEPTKAQRFYSVLTLTQLLWVRMLGRPLLHNTVNLQPENPDNPPTDLYLFYCPQHGPQISYYRGFPGEPSYRLECEECAEIRRKGKLECTPFPPPSPRAA